jgi:hypothetical protein
MVFRVSPGTTNAKAAKDAKGRKGERRTRRFAEETEVRGAKGQTNAEGAESSQCTQWGLGLLRRELYHVKRKQVLRCAQDDKSFMAVGGCRILWVYVDC